MQSCHQANVLTGNHWVADNRAQHCSAKCEAPVLGRRTMKDRNKVFQQVHCSVPIDTTKGENQRQLPDTTYMLPTRNEVTFTYCETHSVVLS